MLAIAIAAHLAKVSESLLKGDSPYFVIVFFVLLGFYLVTHRVVSNHGKLLQVENLL